MQGWLQESGLMPAQEDTRPKPSPSSALGVLQGRIWSARAEGTIGRVLADVDSK